MSYTITQRPDPISLTSTIKDYIIESDEVLKFKVVSGSETILNESYTPDSKSLIYIKDLGKVFAHYLTGIVEFTAPSFTQDGLLKSFRVFINEVEIDNLDVLKCRAYTNITAEKYLNGDTFLNLLFSKKVTTIDAKEYLSCRMGGIDDYLYFGITTYENGSYKHSEFIPGNNFLDRAIITADISFNKVMSFFPNIETKSVVAYRVKRNSTFLAYMVDHTPYQQVYHFLYKNSFNCPETLITRGDIIRKGVPKFETGKRDNLSFKYGITREDTFEVSSGKIFSMNDYIRLKEMIDSEETYIRFNGEYIQILITDESSTIYSTKGKLQSISFTFTFADPNMNNRIIGEAFKQWILEKGTWDDSGAWLDDGQWNDDPV